jgi:hypothetical protein
MGTNGGCEDGSGWVGEERVRAEGFSLYEPQESRLRVGGIVGPGLGGEYTASGLLGVLEAASLAA